MELTFRLTNKQIESVIDEQIGWEKGESRWTKSITDEVVFAITNLNVWISVTDEGEVELQVWPENWEDVKGAHSRFALAELLDQAVESSRMQGWEALRSVLIEAVRKIDEWPYR